MKKTLLATAIAGVVGTLATGAQAATVYNQDGSKLDVYGNLQISWKNVQDEDGNYQDELFDNGSTIGFRGEHIINPNLTGYFRAEFEFNADEQKGYYDSLDNNSDGSGLSKGDQAYLGLTGEFGDLRIGSWDPLMDDWIDDPISNNEYFDNTEAQSDISSQKHEGNKITYTSPIMAGLQFAVGFNYYGDDDELDDYAYNDNIPEDQGRFVGRDGKASPFGGVRYTTGGLTLAAVYDDLDNFAYQDFAGTTTVTNTDAFGNTTTVNVGNYDNKQDFGSVYGMNASYQWDTLRVALKYEKLDADWSSNADVDRYALGARWGYGNGDLYGSYQYVDAEANAVRLVDPEGFDTDNTNDKSYNEVVLGGTYNLSAQMYVYLEGASYDREEDNGTGVATGVVYSF
ncbi:putative porin [Kushneria sinocarnis]|uniref:Putative porin n=1 Tax=Kushneria sinocarnis TaxID=595502 RepID=A0A420WWV4_9GAMM|nr:porin [Kushneria sinocarnis]RKR04194.1 putative porin [Kushneria sinocarnis]